MCLEIVCDIRLSRLARVCIVIQHSVASRIVRSKAVPLQVPPAHIFVDWSNIVHGAPESMPRVCLLFVVVLSVRFQYR